MSKKLAYLVVILALVGSVTPAFGQAPASAPGKGKVLFEYFYNIGAGTTVPDLTSNAKYPNSPDEAVWLDNFLHPAGATGGINWKENYGARGRAYVYPPQTGDYTFWVAGDDGCQLWLSTDDNPANAKLIAEITGWTPAQDWNNTGGGSTDAAKMKSAPIPLKAGQKYYIEGLLKEAGGGDSIGAAWAGPGIGTNPTLIASRYLSAWIRDPEPMFKARDPNPANGATGVLAVGGVTILTFTKGATAGAHDVYFGTSPNPPKLPPRLTGNNTTVISAIPLIPGATYYWRVDEIESGGKVYTGDLWTFVAAPVAAFGPTPRDGDKWIDPDSDLAWQPGTDALYHDLYFSTDRNAVANRDPSVKKGDKLDIPLFEIPTLEIGTIYYWLVDEYDISDIKHEGQVWSFTTNVPGAGGVKAEYFRNMTASGIPFLTVIEPGIDHTWGDGGGPAEGVVDQFSARWTADLEIAIADDYTFIGTSDDGIRAWINDVQIINTWVDRSTADSSSEPQHLEPGIYALVVEYYENGSGAVAQFSWQSPNIARQIIPAGPLQPPVRAKPINPKSGDVNVPQDITLMWSAGEKAATHDVYFGNDEAAVAAATTADAAYKGSQALDKNSFAPGALEWNKTYYWRVDEVNASNSESPWKGPVWKFTTADFLVVDNFESYTDSSPNRVFQTWIDGWGFSADEFFATDNPGNKTGSTVGHDIWTAGTTYTTIMETAIFNPGSGGQSVPFDFNNIVQPYYSETDRTWASPQNWKVNGVNTLVLYFRGYPVKFLETATGISMSGAGTDIVSGTDEFRFAYKKLTGDGSISIKVDSVDALEDWTKAGVMIREHLDPLAMQVHMISAARQKLVEWQYRALSLDTVTTQFNTPANSTPLPVWVRITRVGNVFTGEYSTDGKTWAKITQTAGTDSTITLASMPSTVYIGMVVCSHVARTSTVAQFSEVKTTGNVTGAWQTADIGAVHPGNDADQLYIALEDSSKKLAIVKHPNPQAVLSSTWTAWEIPLSEFTGVNTGAVKKMYIGVGDRTAPKPDGHGSLFFDDLRVIKK